MLPLLARPCRRRYRLYHSPSLLSIPFLSFFQLFYFIFCGRFYGVQSEFRAQNTDAFMTVRRIYAKRAHIDAFRRDMYDNGTILKQAIYHSAVIAHAFGIHVFFDDIKSCKIKPGAANAVIAKRQRYSQLIFVDLTARADSFKASEREKSFRIRESAIQFFESTTTLSHFAEMVDIPESTLGRWFRSYLDKHDPLYALVKTRLQDNRRNNLHF